MAGATGKAAVGTEQTNKTDAEAGMPTLSAPYVCTLKQTHRLCQMATRRMEHHQHGVKCWIKMRHGAGTSMMASDTLRHHQTLL